MRQVIDAKRHIKDCQFRAFSPVTCFVNTRDLCALTSHSRLTPDFLSSSMVRHHRIVTSVTAISRRDELPSAGTLVAAAHAL